MTRLVRRGMAILVLVPVAGYLAIAGFMAMSETRMVYPGVALPPDAGAVPPEGAGVAWDTLRVAAEDGVPVFLLESAVDSGGVAWTLLLHGNGQLVASDGMLERIRLLHEAGMNVLAVEFRGYGASRGAGTPSEAGVVADVRAALAYLTEGRGIARDRVFVYGLSLGSGPATYLAAEAQLAGLVTEGAFTSLPAVAGALYPWLPVSLIMRNRFDNLERAAAVTEPWLVLHGRSDRLIPFAHAERLAGAAPNARLVPLAADHNDGVLADRAVALDALRALVDAATGRDGS